MGADTSDGFTENEMSASWTCRNCAGYVPAGLTHLCRGITPERSTATPTLSHEHRLALDEAIRVYENERRAHGEIGIMGDDRSRLLDEAQTIIARMPYEAAARSVEPAPVTDEEVGEAKRLLALYREPVGTTHYEGCRDDHPRCAIRTLAEIILQLSSGSGVKDG